MPLKRLLNYRLTLSASSQRYTINGRNFQLAENKFNYLCFKAIDLVPHIKTCLQNKYVFAIIKKLIGH